MWYFSQSGEEIIQKKKLYIYVTGKTRNPAVREVPKRFQADREVPERFQADREVPKIFQADREVPNRF